MSNKRTVYNNPGLKTLDVTTSTGIGYKTIISSAGSLEISLSDIIVTTAIINTSTPAVVSLQLVRSASTYTLATASFVDAAVVGQMYEWTPTSSVVLPDGLTYDLTKQPFVALAVGDTIQTNITTAGVGGSVAGAYEVNIVVNKASIIV